jgi:hypothetical protein
VKSATSNAANSATRTSSSTAGGAVMTAAPIFGAAAMGVALYLI